MQLREKRSCYRHNLRIDIHNNQLMYRFPFQNLSRGRAIPSPKNENLRRLPMRHASRMNQRLVIQEFVLRTQLKIII